MKKNEITVPVMIEGYHHRENVSPYDLEGPIDDAIKVLTNLKETYPDKSLSLDWCDTTYDGGYSFYVNEVREKTAEELELEATQKRVHEERNRERDLKELERLQNLYNKG